MEQRTVVTGMGAVTCHGIGIAAFIEALDAGSPPKLEVRTGRYTDYPSFKVAAVPPFDRDAALPNLRRPFPSRYSQLALIAADEAMQSVDWAMTEPSMTGTVVATDFGPNESVERFIETLMDEGPKSVSPTLFAGTTSNVGLGEVARRWHLRGPSTLTLGEQPLIHARDMLRLGSAQAVLCGGVDEVRDVHSWTLNQAGVLGGTASPPGTHDHPGVCLGEGAGFLLIETLSSARSRGAKILAEVVGDSTVHDSTVDHFLSFRTPAALERAMLNALECCDLTPDSVSTVVTAQNDYPSFRTSEAAALQRVWQSDCPRRVNVKCTTGETFGASGPLAIVAAIAAARSQFALMSTPDTVVVAANTAHLGGAISTVILRVARQDAL